MKREEKTCDSCIHCMGGYFPEDIYCEITGAPLWGEELTESNKCPKWEFGL